MADRTPPTPADPMPTVTGACPLCGGSLFLASGGYITCTYVKCPDPTAVADLLLGERDSLFARLVVRHDPDLADHQTWLRSTDPEPGLGSVVVDQDGIAWKRTASHGTRFGWSTIIHDADDPRSWTRLAGNHGPVLLLRAAAALLDGQDPNA